MPYSKDMRDTRELCLAHSKLFLTLKTTQLFMHIIYLWEVENLGRVGSIPMRFKI